MPRIVLEVPRTEHDRIVAAAAQEDVSPRALIVWMLKRDLAERAAVELAARRARVAAELETVA